MNIKEREDQLDKQLAEGIITFNEWTRSWLNSQKDTTKYPDEPKGGEQC